METTKILSSIPCSQAISKPTLHQWLPNCSKRSQINIALPTPSRYQEKRLAIGSGAHVSGDTDWTTYPYPEPATLNPAQLQNSDPGQLLASPQGTSPTKEEFWQHQHVQVIGPPQAIQVEWGFQQNTSSQRGDSEKTPNLEEMLNPVEREEGQSGQAFRKLGGCGSKELFSAA